MLKNLIEMIFRRRISFAEMLKEAQKSEANTRDLFVFMPGGLPRIVSEEGGIIERR